MVTKPIVGVLDAATKTAEGVKNTANIFDQKPNNHRLRFPRAFYGEEKFYRTYMDTDAEILWLLEHAKDARLKEISLINSFDVFPDENDKETSYILALSYEHVICWDVRRGKVLWGFDPKIIQKVNLYPNGMQIDLEGVADIVKVSLF